MAEAYIWRWTGTDGRMLAQTLGCVRQFGVAASLGQPADRIPLLGWKSASEHCVISSRAINGVAACREVFAAADKK
jgi:hypothetical protein